jgi:outer membrane protein assembly factor BamB
VKQSVAAGCLFLIANMIGCGIVSNSYGSVTSMDVKLTIRPPLSVKLWEFGTGGTIISSPAIGDDGTIYFGSADTNLYAINPDGTRKWAFAAIDLINSSPAIGADGSIYFGAGDPFNRNVLRSNRDVRRNGSS